MSNTKTEIKFFSVPAWRKEENYLREQHKKGWEFTAVSGIGFYYFRRCEPKDVIYRLYYNKDSLNNKKEYIQMFSDCGWEYLRNYVGYSYFRKAVSEMNGTEKDIFCDDDSRLDMMRRVFIGRMLPFLAIFFLIIIPQIFVQSNIPENNSLVWIFWGLFWLYLGLFAAFAVSYWKYYKSVHKN